MTFSEITTNRGKDTAHKQSYILTITTHQWTLVKKGFALCQISPTIIAEGGRLIAQEFKLKSSAAMLIISAYGVAHGGNSAAIRLNKGIVRRRILKNLEKIKRDFNRWCYKSKAQSLINLGGDLQDTVSGRITDNSGPPIKRQENGILQWCKQPQHNLVSAGYEEAKRTGSKYITRRGSEGGRGIDHQMVCQNLRTQVVSSGIDPDSFHLNVSFSDHYPVISNFDISFDWNNSPIPDMVRAKYGQIKSIPVKAKLDKGE